MRGGEPEFLKVGQFYLKHNPLLERALSAENIKPAGGAVRFRSRTRGARPGSEPAGGIADECVTARKRWAYQLAARSA